MSIAENSKKPNISSQNEINQKQPITPVTTTDDDDEKTTETSPDYEDDELYLDDVQRYLEGIRFGDDEFIDYEFDKEKYTDELSEINEVTTDGTSIDKHRLISFDDDERRVTFDDKRTSESTDISSEKKVEKVKHKKYKTSPRIPKEEDHKITGDFRAMEDKDFHDKDQDLRIAIYEDSIIEEEQQGEEKEYESEDETIEKIDRQQYYDAYDKIYKELNVERIKNNYLQKKMVDYYTRRNMEYVLKESDQEVDTQQKYDNKLIALGELKNIDKNERNRVNLEIIELKQERDEKLKELNNLFEEMLKIELETAKERTFSQTGKNVSEKFIEHLIEKQRKQSNIIAKLRLDSIKIKNRVDEKQNSLQALDDLGNDLHLIDYEQLKVDNRNQMDKLEERENDLTVLRTKCRNSMQILAHLREKSSSLDTTISTLKKRLQEVNHDYQTSRTHLNHYKKERDKCRHSINKLKDDSGLLTQTLLLKDMENAINEVNKNTNELKILKDDYKLKSDHVRIIRKNMEYYVTDTSKDDAKQINKKKNISKISINKSATSNDSLN